MEVIPVTNRTWEAHSWSSGLKASSSECQFLRRALAADHFFAPPGIWLVCFGKGVLMPSKAFAADGEGEQGNCPRMLPSRSDHRPCSFHFGLTCSYPTVIPCGK